MNDVHTRSFVCKDNKIELNNAIVDSISIILNNYKTAFCIISAFVSRSSFDFIVILLENHLNLPNCNFVVFNVHLISYICRCRVGEQ